MNSDRFLQRESIAYARATFAGSRVFQASSARRTFCIALSLVNGGKGGRAGVVGVAMFSSPRLRFACLYSSRRSRTFGFTPMKLPACQQEIDESQRHQHE